MPGPARRCGAARNARRQREISSPDALLQATGLRVVHIFHISMWKDLASRTSGLTVIHIHMWMMWRTRASQGAELRVVHIKM